jgi:toxin-antitoxin system PIN domain toxin
MRSAMPPTAASPSPPPRTFADVLAVDTNVLVYAHRRDSPFHEPAAAAVRELAESPADWAIPWPCLHEFYSVVTHPRIYRTPSTPVQALAQLEQWHSSPSLVLLAETQEHLEILATLVSAAKVAGPVVHDARIAALCQAHGVRELLTLDRDFSRFPSLTTRSVLG